MEKRAELYKKERYEKGFSLVLLMRFLYHSPLEEIDCNISNLELAYDIDDDPWNRGARDAYNLLEDIERNPKYETRLH